MHSNIGVIIQITIF